jgi:hypothetical protein
VFGGFSDSPAPGLRNAWVIFTLALETTEDNNFRTFSYSTFVLECGRRAKARRQHDPKKRPVQKRDALWANISGTRLNIKPWPRRRDSTLRNVPGAPWLCVAPGRAHDLCAQGGRAKGGRASSGSHGGGGRPAARRRCSQGGALRTAGSSLSPPSLTALPWCSARRRGPRLAPGSAPPSARLPRPPAPAREVGVSAGWLAAGSASASGVEKCTAAARPQQGDRARAGGRACGRAGGR